MKKLLALVLALVMTLGLATVGTSAALSDFSDASDVNYEDAMAVMNAVGVFVGDNGKLAPKDNLTRAQAAKIIAYLNLGGSAADALSKDITAFSDVAAGNWAAGYITYCYNAGIIAGDGTGKFNPNDNVTALQFAKMLLVTLGYDAQREGLVGADYALNTTKLAAKTKLYDGNESVSVNVPATREEAALYAFNALSAECVEYDSAPVTIGNSDGSTITVGGSSAKTYGTADDQLGDGNNHTQLSEKLYGNKLTVNTGDADGMGRPADGWTYKGKSVTKEVDTADYTYVVADSGKTDAAIIDKISKTIDESAATWKLNGDNYIYGTNTLAVGDKLEVFMKSTPVNTIDKVIITRYSVNKVTAAVATKGSGDSLEIRVPGITGYKDAEDITGYADLAKGDYVYYYEDAAGKVTLGKAASFEGKLTSIMSGSPNKYVFDGTQYKLNGSTGATASIGNTYTVYTDDNGYIVKAVEIEKAAKDYVVVNELKYVTAGGGIGEDARVEARIVKMDGTTAIVKVDSVDDGSNKYAGGDTTAVNTAYDLVVETGEASDANAKDNGAVGTAGNSLNDAVDILVNTAFFTYTTNSDNEYAFTKVTTDVGTQTAVTIEKNKASIVKTGVAVPVNENTVFIVAKSSGGHSFTVYTGKSAVPSFDALSADVAYVLDSSVAQYVFVPTYTGLNDKDSAIFLASASPVGSSRDVVDGKNVDYNLYRAIVNGEATDIKVLATVAFKEDDGTTTAPAQAGLFNPIYDDNGRVKQFNETSGDACTDRAEARVIGYEVDGTTLIVNTAVPTAIVGYTAAADAAVYSMNSDKEITKLTVGELNEDKNDELMVVLKSNGDVDYLFIIEKSDSATGLSVTYNGAAADTTTSVSAVGSTPAYTQYTWSSASYTHNLVITPSAFSTVKYNTSGSWTTFGTTMTYAGLPALTGSNISVAADTTYNVQVTAVDGTVAYYQFVIDDGV